MPSPALQRAEPNRAWRGNLPTHCAAATRRGRRSAPSLPVKLRPFTVAEKNERPFLRARDKLFANGILQNVIRLLAAAFVMSQSMLKEITLPNNANFFGGPFLPFVDDKFRLFF